ncbi:MAG: cytochrome c maturation protein CcmE [Acetobacteraceae bacterium]|nr:cytochrome c maturation protein CcmE [Acetobacteraceae bacterium]
MSGAVRAAPRRPAGLRRRKHRRLAAVGLVLAGLGLAVGLFLSAIEENLVFFRSPSDVLAAPPPPERAFRLGGLVEAGSVERGGAAMAGARPEIRFRVTDGANTIQVVFSGVLPDLFREGQGVVTLGRLGPDGVFRATEVLARHDETYMPPEVAEALRRAGHWDPAQGAPPPPAGWNTLNPRGGGG